MGVRLAQVGTQLPNFAGYPGPYTSMSSPGLNGTVAEDDSSTKYFWGFQTAPSANNCFRSSTKAAPTVYTQHNTPVGALTIGGIVVANDDLVFYGLNDSGITRSRVYSFVPSTGVHTSQNWPLDGSSDSMQELVMNLSVNSDILYASCFSSVGSPTVAGVFQLTISTNTWLRIAGAGTGFTLNQAGARCNISLYGTSRILCGAGLGGANGADVYISSLISDGPPYTWTRIAGNGLNNSWALGTKRNVRPSEVNGVIYAGTGGASGGDAEVWKQDPTTGLWSQIGGDGLNGSWAAGTHTVASFVIGRGNILLCAVSGTVNGDAEGWQYDLNTGLWTQVAGDGLNSSWAANRLNANVRLTQEGAVIWGGGNNSVGTAFAYIDPGGAFVPGATGGFGVLSRKSSYPFANF
jgi:hypothetical protein